MRGEERGSRPQPLPPGESKGQKEASRLHRSLPYATPAAMSAPSSPKNIWVTLVLPIVAGLITLSLVAAFNQKLAFALAIGAIGFAAISMLAAVLRKH